MTAHFDASNSISGLAVEYILAIDVTRFRFPADALFDSLFVALCAMLKIGLAALIETFTLSCLVKFLSVGQICAWPRGMTCFGSGLTAADRDQVGNDLGSSGE